MSKVLAKDKHDPIKINKLQIET